MRIASRSCLSVVLVAATALLAAGSLYWSKVLRESEPVHPPRMGRSADDLRFMYGSVGAEQDGGIPFWIFQVLPRVFPDKLPGPGGYASLGFCWEEGEELPVGFTRKIIGFERVANNCAACHTARYRAHERATPVFVPAGPSHTLDLEAFYHFVLECAKDWRFNPDTLMEEIDRSTRLSPLDRAYYRYVLIPATKKELLARELNFAWIRQHRSGWPAWGRGRQDAANLTKYFLAAMPLDHTGAATDTPAIWNLLKFAVKRDTRLNATGETWDVHSAVIDSLLALLGAAPASNAAFEEEAHWLQNYLEAYDPPRYPFEIDSAATERGRSVFDAHCRSCHLSARTGTVIPIAEVGTDAERLHSWSRAAAIRSNRAVDSFGIRRKGFVEADPIGYVAPFLDGVWLRAPYLHNGSVPTLRDLLRPASERPMAFYRGYDLYDRENVGFVTHGPEATRVGSPYEVRLRGNSNQGHEFGVELPEGDKTALLEYLKTL